MRVNAAVLSRALSADLQNHIDISAKSWDVHARPHEVACYQLRDAFMKKFVEGDSPSPTACASALKKFLAVNERCGEWVLRPEHVVDEYLIGGLKKAIYEFWYPVKDPDHGAIVSDYRELFARGRSGPGASLSARGMDFYTKFFDSPLSSSSEDLTIVWSRCASMNALWSDANRVRDELHGVQLVESSKLSFVNKTTDIARTICTEPSINMWMQLGMASVLEDRLKRYFGVDIRGQKDNYGRLITAPQPDISRQMACEGSFNGCYSTIDLESASDSLSLHMLREILPRGMFSFLASLRCASTILPTKEVVPLNMISTMGNGYTFPLQTVLFCSVVKSVYTFLSIPFNRFGKSSDRNFSVFGDDIIVDTRATRLVLRLLNLLGFRVNTDKTFVEGPFRESCGADYYDGVNVRAVYCKKLSSEQDLFSVINNLNRWCARFEIYLPRTIATLCKGVRRPLRRFVPPDEDDSAGIHVPESFALANGYKLERSGLIHYYPMVPREWAFYILGDVIWTYKEQVRRNYNPSGLMLAFLAGGIRGYSISLRQSKIRYTTKRRCTPRWGYLPPRPLEDPNDLSRCRRFAIACDRNFVSSGFWSMGT
jgi:hypothetical protein